MTVKNLYELFQSSVESMSYDVDIDFGTPTEMDLRMAEDDYRLPFIWVFNPTYSDTQYANSIAAGTAWNIAAIAFVEDDIDPAPGQRMKSLSEADRVIKDFVGQLRLAEGEEGNYFNDVSYAAQPNIRKSTGVWCGYGFNITANSDGTYDFCC